MPAKRARIGQRHHVEEQARLRRGALEQRELRRAGRAVLDRRVAVARVVELRGAQRFELLLGARLRKLRRGLEERGLHDQARRLLRARLARDHPARRRRRARADPDGLERRRVQHRAVARLVDQHDRVVRERRVEIVARHLALLGEALLVVAVRDDPLARAARLLVRIERRDQLGDVRRPCRPAAAPRWPSP